MVIFELTIREGTGGKEALRNIKLFDPQVKAVIVSGYAEDQIIANPEDNLRIFVKPYPFNDLKKALREMLGPGQKDNSRKVVTE